MNLDRRIFSFASEAEHLEDCHQHAVENDKLGFFSNSCPRSNTEKQEYSGYDFLGKPRTSGQGGGAGIYISQSIPFQRRLDLEDNDIECIWIEILFPKSKGFLIGVIYRPPDSSKHLPDNFNETFESMMSTVVSEDKECILTGDINCNYLEGSDHKDLKAILSSFNLKQLISSPTRITKE